MEKKNYQSVLQDQSLYRLRMLQRSGILKMKSRTLLRMALSQVFKLAFKILMIYFQLILVSLLRSLVYRLLGNRISSIKWLLATTITMAGKQHSLHLKMYRHTSMLINSCEKFGRVCRQKVILEEINGHK